MRFIYPVRQSISRLFGMSSIQINNHLNAPPVSNFFSPQFHLDDEEQFNKVVDQDKVEKEERRIWGLFVMWISHLTGLHPIRAPFFCTADQCVKLSLYQRLSILDICMWTVNFLTCLNHIFLRFFQPGLLTIWVSMDSVYLLRESIVSFYPLMVLLISCTNSSGLDRLLHLLSNTKREISQSNNNQRIRRWRFLMFALNGLFLAAFVANFTVILLHNILNDEVNLTLFPMSQQSNSKAESCFSEWISMSACFDDAYFEVMAFCVGEIPRIFIMMMAIEIGFLFKENSALLSGKRLTTERLIDFHEQFQKSTTILAQLESTFNKLILLVVSYTIAVMTLNFYVILQYISTIHQTNNNSNSKTISVLFDFGLLKQPGEMVQNFCQVVLIVEAMNFCLKLSWTLGFIVACVWCNEKSRSSLSHLLNGMALGDTKPIKDQLVQKLQDYSWGITMAKFMRMERTVLITMTSIAFTVVVVWLQLSNVKN